MSIALYEQRLYYDAHKQKGCLKYNGIYRNFTEKPAIPGLKFEGLDVAPETDTWMIMRRFEGWSEMHPDEIKAALAYLLSVNEPRGN